MRSKLLVTIAIVYLVALVIWVTAAGISFYQSL